MNTIDPREVEAIVNQTASTIAKVTRIPLKKARRMVDKALASAMKAGSEDFKSVFQATLSRQVRALYIN